MSTVALDLSSGRARTRSCARAGPTATPTQWTRACGACPLTASWMLRSWRPKCETGVACDDWDCSFRPYHFRAGKMGGRACIRGMRITVTIVGLVAEGETTAAIL